MLTKKQFFVLLSIYILYMLIGAAIFYHIEGIEEVETREIERKERQEIEELLTKHYMPSDEELQDELFEKLTTYCGKPLSMNMTEIETPFKWDYYHSVFFVITVVSTIGYGNISPTTMLSRIFCIFYAFIGIPINGIVMVAMGGYFGHSFESLYNRWKKSSMKYDFARLGLITQVILYLIPGFMFFIFLPAMIFMLFEGWEYDVSVYYAFITLSTIGFGDYVAGDEQYEYSYTVYWIYKVFLLFWVIIGLGYLSMILGYISQAMTSKHVKQLEHAISTHIKKTPIRIRNELRALLNEAMLTKVKRVYKHSIVQTSTLPGKSQSCPDLTIYRNMESPTMFRRKRALSECPYGQPLLRIQSDTDLNMIDKEKTFSTSQAVVEPSELLLRVVSALGNYENESSEDADTEERGINIFSDSQILESENMNGHVDSKLNSLPCYLERQRSPSKIEFPYYDKVDNNNLTWYGQTAAENLREFRERCRTGRVRRTTVAVPESQPSLFTRIKNTFLPNKEEIKKDDVERQEYIQQTAKGRFSIFAEPSQYLTQTNRGRQSTFSSRELSDEILENTSIAEFIRALSALSVPVIQAEAINTDPKRKFGTAAPPPSYLFPPYKTPPRTRRHAIQPHNRRSSLVPSASHHEIRRFSLRPVNEGSLLTVTNDHGESRNARRGSNINVSKEDGGTRLLSPDPPTIASESQDSVQSAPSLPPTYLSQELSRMRPPVVRRYSLRSGTISITPSPIQKQVMKRDKDKDNKDKDDHDRSS